MDDIVELIVVVLRRKRAELVRLFSSPGQIIIHIDPKARSIKLEVRVRV